jgi:hypothetical protein
LELALGNPEFSKYAQTLILGLAENFCRDALLTIEAKQANEVGDYLLLIAVCGRLMPQSIKKETFGSILEPLLLLA